MAYPTTEYKNQSFGALFLTNILNWVAVNYKPQDLWTDAYLEDWAKDNGYIKDEVQWSEGQ